MEPSTIATRVWPLKVIIFAQYMMAENNQKDANSRRYLT